MQELAKFGEVQNLNVCDNLADHMVGSVYAKARPLITHCELQQDDIAFIYTPCRLL